MLLTIGAAVVAMLACLLLARTADALVRILRPLEAVLFLCVCSVSLALATGIALTAAGLAAVARIGPIAQGRWSAGQLRAEVPIPGWLGTAAAVAVAVLLGRAGYRTLSIVVALLRADRVCRSITPADPVIVVDDDSIDAFTIAGTRGRVIISSGLLAVLSSDERRILTAHELSHLGRRHHLYIHAVDIAAAANPLLRSVGDAIRLAVERWADEDAAAACGDRRMTGRTLARVALLRSALRAGGSRVSAGPVVDRPPYYSPLGNLAAVSHSVVTRVQALLDPAAQPRTGRLTAGALAAVLVLLVGLASLLHIRAAIETADLVGR